MSYRSRTNRRSDRKMFKRTAASSKKINVVPLMYRGGIKL